MIRYVGTDTALEVDYDAEIDVLKKRFDHAHLHRFGFVDTDRSTVVEAISVELVLPMKPPASADARVSRGTSEPATVEAFLDGRLIGCRTFQRDQLPDEEIQGPALIVEPNSTIVVEPGWNCARTAGGQLVLQRAEEDHRNADNEISVDPVRLEIFNKLFMSVAEQMGHTLQNTSYSVNMKERLDFSCALFDSAGNLVSNAPHMPVHLGSMGDTVASVIDERGDDIAAGDCYIHNAPYRGGTHLPDVTVISPVFDDTGGELLFYVASRGHHADIGGISPGSMPPDSRSVEEEGVLIDNFLGVRDGKLREAELLELLSSGPYPARNPLHNPRRSQGTDRRKREGRT